MKGFSPRNLEYMRAFAEAWPDQTIVQAVLAQITWYHDVALLEKTATSEQRLFYAHKSVEAGWSRNVLVAQIDSKLYERQGKAVTNFGRALPSPHSDLAQQTLKDPYLFGFLGLEDDAQERDAVFGSDRAVPPDSITLLATSTIARLLTQARTPWIAAHLAC